MTWNAEPRGGPLAGVRIIELGTMIAGPVAATLLGDLGAEIIKVEAPGTGDPIRHSGPFAGEESLYWHVEGRSKQSVTLDLRQSAGQAVLRRLAAKADVLIENFRPGTMARWQMDFDTLHALNPRLVMLSISGYGQTGPKSPQPAYDRVSLAFAGFLNMTGYADRPPVRPGTAMADYQAALFGAFSIMVALYERDARGGTGQQIDLALFEAVFRFTDVMITAFDKLGLGRERRGNRHFAAAPGDHYETQDGRYIAMTIAANNVFQRLCDAIGRPELAQDPRFDSHINRVDNYDAINGIVADWIRSRPVADAIAAFEANGIPHSLIYTPADILADPHYAARDVIATVDHPTIGPLKMPGVLPHLSGSAAPRIDPAPSLGADTDRIFHDLLGMSDDEIGALRQAGVV